MKILVILTGGTIGSKAEGTVIDVNQAAAYMLIQLYREKYGNDVTFEVIQPLNVLSENMNPSHWEVLLSTLAKVDFANYDGVIITHGSDTISYTSALVGYCYRHVQIPIILIASNYNLQDSRSNGLSNFYHAVCFIKDKTAKGVFVIFRNNKEESIVYLATRMIEADTYCDQFSTYGGTDFGKMINSHFVATLGKQNPTTKELAAPKEKIEIEEYRFSKRVLLVRPYPGLDYSYINLDENIGAVLHCTYHSSTACSKSENHSASDFVKRCKEKEIPVYMCSFKQDVSRLYASSTEILAAGAIPLMNISTEAAYTKLMLAYNLLNTNQEEFMKENIYYEILPALDE